MSEYFTADTHFGHTNIIKMCNRPFKDIEEMNEVLIQNWNNVVSDDDIVYHLGDFAYFTFNKKKAKLSEEKETTFRDILQRLKGKIIIIRGNHDYNLYRSIFEEYNVELVDYKELYINNHNLILFHYPIAEWNHKYKGSWHLHGHSHGNHQFQNGELAHDIGVDVNNYTPQSIEQIETIMEAKISSNKL